jgi:hypothetical protein
MVAILGMGVREWTGPIFPIAPAPHQSQASAIAGDIRQPPGLA